MARLTRAQQQERTRATVLAAATEEFTEHCYAEAKVDRIADRAELTRGAVYSNFPSKRALYLAVLLSAAPQPVPGDLAAMPGDLAAVPGDLAAVPGDLAAVPGDLAAAAESFARVWLERLPLAGDPSAAGRLRSRSLTGVFDDEPGRAARAELTRLEGLLLALALESRAAGRRVRLAELIQTLLTGAAQLAETAPGAGDPFDVARACRHLAGLDLGDVWDPPHLPFVAPARPCRDPWRPPAGLTDVLTGSPADLGGDGLVVVLGTSRLGAAEEAVRAARPEDLVTLGLVPGDRAETGALARLRITDLAACLRRVFGPALRPPVQLILDDRAALAEAVGAGTAEDTEIAVRVRAGEVVARAAGRGAGHAAAASPTRTGQQP